MTGSHGDIIDLFAGVEPGEALDRLRRGRSVTRENAEASFRALFEPTDPKSLTPLERFAIAAFVALLHESGKAADFYADELRQRNPKVAETVLREAQQAQATGPFGNYPAGPLSNENTTGIIYYVSRAARAFLGERLAAGLDHAHLLVFHPRDASPEDHQRLLDTNWTTSDIVTLSQIVAFLSFQLRVVHGLDALAASGTEGTPS